MSTSKKKTNEIKQASKEAVKVAAARMQNNKRKKDDA